MKLQAEKAQHKSHIESLPSHFVKDVIRRWENLNNSVSAIDSMSYFIGLAQGSLTNDNLSEETYFLMSIAAQIVGDHNYDIQRAPIEEYNDLGASKSYRRKECWITK